jgi:putative restriction endonuclease
MPHVADLHDAMAQVRVWTRGKERAVHKPLLLLMALARVQRGDPRLVRFSDLEEPLRALLRDFGPTRRSFHPEYPFWRLQNDGLWEVKSDAPLRLRQGHADPTVSSLRESNARGGFPEDIEALLRADPGAVGTLAVSILADTFPASLHGEILDAVGLSITAPTVAGQERWRDPAFRGAVLTAYGYRCAVCGFDARLDGRTLGLEAAHVRWHTHDGPSAVDNGVALCSLHHKALDLGLMGLADDLTVMVTNRLDGGDRVAEVLVGFHGRPLLGPKRGEPVVRGEFRRWHFDEVFKQPARAA